MLPIILSISLTCDQFQKLIDRVYLHRSLSSAQIEEIVNEVRKFVPKNCSSFLEKYK
jgi:hypothetical protein